MKHQRLVLLLAAFVAAGASGCFKDPTKPLRGGGALLSLSRQDVYVHVGDSVAVVAELKDNQGNVLPAAGASWTSGDATIAAVRADTALVPGNYFTRAFIRGVTTTGGWTTVIVAVGNVQDSVRVVVLPVSFVASLVARAGANAADTVPASAAVISAPDTLVLNGTSVLNFDTSQVSVYAAGNGKTSKGFVVAKTPAQLKVIFTVPAVGKIVIKHLLAVTGNPAVGNIVIDSLVADSSASTAVSRWRFGAAAFGGGSVGQLGDTMTVTAAGNQTFTASTTVGFGAGAAITLSRTATALTVLSPVTYSGQVTLYNVKMNGGPGVASVTLDSIKTNAVTPYAINGATFPAANVVFSPNNARMFDTVIVTAPSGLTFKTGTGPSLVILGTPNINGDTAWVLSRTTTLMKVLPMRGGTGKVKVTNLVLGSGAVIPSLSTPANIPIDSVASDQVPANTEAAAHPLVLTVGVPVTVYGTVNVNTLPNDFWTFTTTTSQKITITVSWFGTGNPYNTNNSVNADLDALVCNLGMACDESVPDLLGYAAASASQPETGTTATQPAGQYWVNVIPFSNVYTVAYRLIVVLQ